MSAKPEPRRMAAILIACALPLLLVGVSVVGLRASPAQALSVHTSDELEAPAKVTALDSGPSVAPSAPCPGGPTIDGILLDECVVHNLTVAGDAKTITVWYTKNPVTTTRAGVGRDLEHWINTDAQAQQVADWAEDAWQRYHVVFGRHPWHCTDNMNFRLEDGAGDWSGVARWNSSDCNIGIHARMVRNGGGQGTVYHEVQHFVQRSYNSGCFGEVGPAYPANSEYIEGYADLGEDSVDATLDATGYGNSVAGYNPLTSFFDKGYNDVYSKYYVEQVGSQWTPADPHHHFDAVREHYEECDVQDTLYVLDTLIPSLTGGVLTQETLFLNFFAANWAKDWADAATQPTLVYTDDDGNPYGTISLAQNVALSTGSQSWTGETTPDDWAGRYYQVRPQAGCEYITISVDGAAGARLGINLMAADTTAPTSVSRAGWIGEDFSRTFAAAGVHDRVVAVVNAFANTGSYDVSFTCVAPAIEIMEPDPRPNHVLVGDPTSPIAFLTRFQVTSGGTPVLGLPEASFSADAEGDAATFVAGSFQEVGEEYWATMIPPTKAAGTTFVDFRVCLDTTICATHTDALLYVDPGNSDFALLFDASGSMKKEDVPGEGTRYENARKAATVLADLLRTGDRIAVMDFGARNVPVDCGIPYGDGNCPLHIVTHLARTDVTGAGTIGAVKTAISGVSYREEWTPIGGGLREAKNVMQAAPYSINPKIIVLLSDGEENVNPLYNAVRTELIASGVIIDTIGLSGEAPQPLLAQIAADTGGIYRFVPTTGGTAARLRTEQLNELRERGVSDELVSSLAAGFLPGPLALDNVYDYFDTKNQGATRLFHSSYTSVADNTWNERSMYVDGSVNTLRLVVAGKQEDNDVPGYCSGYHRSVEVLPPFTSQRQWIPVSPPVYSTSPPPPPPPPSWDIRNSLFDDVVIIPNPEEGLWRVRAKYYWQICASGQVDEQATANAVAARESDFIINGSVQSDYRLQGRFLAPIVGNQGKPGDRVPIVATLLSRAGTVPGATVLAAIERPDRTDIVWLWDNGESSDGMADDGIYGTHYSLTDVGGTYNVRLLAYWNDATSGEQVTREWLGAFWIQEPAADDEDKDGMPGAWEKRCNLDPDRNDAEGDPDRDDLINIDEFHRGTSPCDPDTDDGGERDGSEVAGGRNPLYAPDDLCNRLGHVTLEALNERVAIRWPRPQEFTDMMLYVSEVPGQLGEGRSIGADGSHVLSDLANDQRYYLTLAGMYEEARCVYTEPGVVIPRLDPDPPFGSILINGGAPTTISPHVMLDLGATDDPLPGPVSPSSAPMRSALALAHNAISGATEMKISNDASLADASWEPIVYEKPWVLGDAPTPLRRVFAQYRDAAGNESFIVYDDITLLTGLYLAPELSTVPVSGTVTVDLRIDNIQDLYAAQVELTFDPALIEVVDASDFDPGIQIEEGDFPIPDDVVRNQANNTNGTIEYAVSLRGVKPGVSGGGVLARITFHGLTEGVSPVDFTRSILSDPQSLPIDHVTQNGEVIVRSATGIVSGKVILERRTSNAGATVCVDSLCANTTADGSYIIPDIPPGPYTATASRMSYLRSWKPVEVPLGLLALPDVILLGGDVNQDDHIHLPDANHIGWLWLTTPSDADWDQRADITDDGNVNILDTVAVQFNWNETAPGPWGTTAGRQRAAPSRAQASSLDLATQVVFSPAQAAISGVGETVEVEVYVQDVSDLYSAWFTLSFDPSVVQVRDADPRPSKPGVQLRPGEFLDPFNQFVLINEADNTAGTAEFAVTQLRPAVAQSGSGVLATVIFEGAAEGSSTVQFTGLQLLDASRPEPLEISTGTQDGQVTVGAQSTIYLPVALKGS